MPSARCLRLVSALTIVSEAEWRPLLRYACLGVSAAPRLTPADLAHVDPATPRQPQVWLVLLIDHTKPAAPAEEHIEAGQALHVNDRREHSEEVTRCCDT